MAFAFNLVRIVINAKLDLKVHSLALAKILVIDESKSACFVGIKTQGIINRTLFKLSGRDIFLVQHFFAWLDFNSLVSIFIGFFIVGITICNDSENIKW